MKGTSLLLMLSLFLTYACNSENNTESENIEETKVEDVVRQAPETVEKKVTSSVSDFADWSIEKIDETLNQTDATLTDMKEKLKEIEDQIGTSTGDAKTRAEAKQEAYLKRIDILEDKLTNLNLAKRNQTSKEQ